MTWFKGIIWSRPSRCLNFCYILPASYLPASTWAPQQWWAHSFQKWSVVNIREEISSLDGTWPCLPVEHSQVLLLTSGVTQSQSVFSFRWGFLDLHGNSCLLCISLSTPRSLMAYSGLCWMWNILAIPVTAWRSYNLGWKWILLEAGNLCTSLMHPRTQRYVLFGRESMWGGPVWPCWSLELYMCHFLCSGDNKFSSVTQSCPTLCDPMNHSTPGLPVHHQLPEFTQTHVHRVGDAIQPSHPLSSPSPPAPNPSQHQGLFQWVNSSHEVAKVLALQL